MIKLIPGAKAKCGAATVTILGVASNGMYACEYDSGAVGFLNTSDLVCPVTEPEQVVRWVNLYEENLTSTHYVFGQSLGNDAIARTRVVLTPGVFEDENTPSEYDRGWNEALEAAVKMFAEQGWRNPVEGYPISMVTNLTRSTP